MVTLPDENQQAARLLIVEDDAGQRLVLCDIFESEGLEAIGCGTGEAALEIAQRQEIAVAIVDFKLPGLTGVETLERLRAIDGAIRVIIHTGYGSFDSAKDAVNLGAFAYVEKPADPAGLVHQVHRAAKKWMEQALRQSQEDYRTLAQMSRQLEAKNREILHTQAQLVQSEKMASVGQLVAGVAHEINNPVTFISSGVPSLERDLDKLAALIPEGQRNERYDKVRTRLARLVEAIADGARRTAEIVKNLRTFSRLDEATVKVTDLHAALDSTLSLLRNQTRDRIRIVRQYGDLPPVECYLGQLNQVFMNLLVNAVQAIDGEGAVTLTTARAGEGRVRISIRDTGRGMNEEVRAKIFDPFFTDKPVGQGTGLGLSISHGIVEKHGGEIGVASAPGEGTEVTITLPIRLPTGEAAPEPEEGPAHPAQ